MTQYIGMNYNPIVRYGYDTPGPFPQRKGFADTADFKVLKHFRRRKIILTPQGMPYYESESNNPCSNVSHHNHIVYRDFNTCIMFRCF